MKLKSLLMGIVVLGWPTLGLAQTFDVTLVKVEALRLFEESDEYSILLDGEHWSDAKRMDVKAEQDTKQKPASKVKFWRFGGKQPLTRNLNVTCLKQKPINSRFNFATYEADGEQGSNELGAIDVTLAKSDGDLQLRFDDCYGLHEFGRVVEKDKVYWWVTLRQPSASPPAEYKHFFEITVNMDP